MEAVTQHIEGGQDLRSSRIQRIQLRQLQTGLRGRRTGVHTRQNFQLHQRSVQQIIYCEEGNEAEAVEAARTGVTKLTTWFTLNESDPDARTILYADIPYHYVFRNNRCNKWVQGREKIVGRMYGVSPRERFCLRLLLLHIPGARNYEYLRTLNNRKNNLTDI